MSKHTSKHTTSKQDCPTLTQVNNRYKIPKQLTSIGDTSVNSRLRNGYQKTLESERMTNALLKTKRILSLTNENLHVELQINEWE